MLCARLIFGGIFGIYCNPKYHTGGLLLLPLAVLLPLVHYWYTTGYTRRRNPEFEETMYLFRRMATYCTLVALMHAPYASPSSVRKQTLIQGYHVDNEQCSGLFQNNRSAQEVICHTFFTRLSNLSAEVHTYGTGMVLSVDAGTAWSCPPGATTCFNITFHNKTQSVAAHVVDLADVTVVMDYDREPSNVLRRALPYLMHAQNVQKDRSIVIGLAISELGQKPEWWQTGTY